MKCGVWTSSAHTKSYAGMATTFSPSTGEADTVELCEFKDSLVQSEALFIKKEREKEWGERKERKKENFSERPSSRK